MRIEGRCRDLLTGHTLEQTRSAREDTMVASLNWERIIQSVQNDRLDLGMLKGARGGGHLRAALDEHIHAERVTGTPLYLLLDDISGVSLVSGWSWSRWQDDWMEQSSFNDFDQRRKMMENVCTGFATGSSALTEERSPQNNPQVLPLPDPEDTHSWHTLPEIEHVGFRRSRRIDVWKEDSVIMVDVGFQDSASDPKLERVAIHEYHLFAKADISSNVLLELTATPHVLPFPECPGAVANIQQLVGTPLPDMRTKVIDTLPGVKGCTHLNDVMRGLAEVPALCALLS